LIEQRWAPHNIDRFVSGSSLRQALVWQAVLKEKFDVNRTKTQLYNTLLNTYKDRKQREQRAGSGILAPCPYHDTMDRYHHNQLIITRDRPSLSAVDLNLQPSSTPPSMSSLSIAALQRKRPHTASSQILASIDILARKIHAAHDMQRRLLWTALTAEPALLVRITRAS